MRMFDIIKKKRDGEELTKDEIDFFVKGYTIGEIPDEQVAALLMAIFFRDMTTNETIDLTKAIVNSGDIVDLSPINGVKVDKHSTGGVGDKTSLIVAPIVASLGVKVAKMSGRGLGHTGGTVDKLESIPGYKTTLDRKEFFDIVNNIGVSIIGQSGRLAPADKKLYALRDITATVDKMPLIAASIMGKKLAAGADAIVLDVKTGSGSFNKTVEIAQKLARTMVDIGNGAGKKTVAIITDMDIPLGRNVGNSLEVIEAIETLKGCGPKDLEIVCVELAANMLYLAEKGNIEDCRIMVKNAIKDGSAFNKFVEMVKAHGGDENVILDTDKFVKAKYKFDVKADSRGYIEKLNTEDVGVASLLLGAGRNKKEDFIDYSAGIVINKKTGDFVNYGETIATLYANDEKLFMESATRLTQSLVIGEDKLSVRNLILGRVE